MSKEGDPIYPRDTSPLPEQQPDTPKEQSSCSSPAWADWWFWGWVQPGSWPEPELARINLAAWDICSCLGPFFGLEREQPLPDRLHQLCARLERLFSQPEEGPRLAGLLSEQAQLQPLRLALSQLFPAAPQAEILAELPPLLLAISGFCYGLGLGVQQDQSLARSIFSAGQQHSPQPAQKAWFQTQLERLCPLCGSANAGRD